MSALALFAALALGAGCGWYVNARQKVADARAYAESPSLREAVPDAATDPGPRCLGAHPERIPVVPGRMSVEDSTDAVRAAIRLTRDAAARRESRH